jgi:type I restriction enzyme, S subunit
MIKELTMEKTDSPVDWEMKPLGEVCEILDNLRKPITKRDRIEGEYPYYGATGVLSYINDYIFDEKLVLIGEDGAKWFSGANSSFIVNGKYWVNNHAHVIRPNRTILLDEWIVYFLNYSDLEEFVTGMTVPKLNQGNLKTIPIPLPPLPKQKQIVSILDKAFAVIDVAKANAEQNLQNAKELFESYLQNVFENKGDDWEEKSLNEISENLDRQRVPITKKDRKEGEIPYYGASGIVDYVQDFLFDEDLLCISEDGANLLARTYPIAFSISGKTWVNNHAHILRFENTTSQYFVEYYLNSIKLDDFVSGMAQPKLNQTKLNTIPIPFPNSIKEREKVVLKLDALTAECKKLESIYTQKLADLEEMKKSILQKAFSGQLSTIN